MSTLKIIQIALFVCGSMISIFYSWRYLTNPRVHGFYRFFGWEATILLVFFNLPGWFNNPLAPLQIASWILLCFSIVPVVYGFVLLAKRGKPHGSFEDTTVIVDTGIFKYIRHPMYTSLILLSLGVALKNTDLLSLVLVFAATLFYYLTAKVEEEEDLAKFGEGYRKYMAHTRMFIPYIF